MKIPWKAVAAGMAVPVISLIFFAVALQQASRVPEHTDWKAAAAVVRAGWADGDRVAFMPQWAQGASPWLQGLDVDTGENPDWYEASKVSRLWLISSMYGRGDGPPGNWTRLNDLRLDRVDVSLWKPPADRHLLFDFTDNMEHARVSRARGRTVQYCTTFKNDRWYCGAEHPWLYVGLESRDIAGRVRDVIWAHAVDRAIVKSEWSEVPRGGTLTVHYGLTQRAAEAREGSPALFTIQVDGVEIFRDTLEVDEHGWFRRDFKLDGEGTAKVAFTVEAENPQSRQVCFTADVWK